MIQQHGFRPLNGMPFYCYNVIYLGFSLFRQNGKILKNLKFSGTAIDVQFFMDN